MDEENNNSGIVKDAVKNEAQKAKNKAIKKIAKKIISALAPIIFVIFIVLLIIGVILLVVNTVISAIKGFLGLGDDDSATIGQDVKAAVSISQDGYSYVINDAFIDNIIQSLEAGQLNTADLGLTYPEGKDTDENGDIKESMIKKYVKAEVRTMFPKIDSATGIDGLITIKRDNGENGTEAKNLTYTPYNNFKSKVEAGDENYCQTHFSLNPENFNLCYSTANILEEYDYTGKQTSRTVTLTMNEVDYQYLVEPYAMPSNFLVSTHFIAQDEDFMNDILKLQEANDGIEITLKDTVNTTTITVDYSGKIYEKTNETARYTNQEDESSGIVYVNKENEYNIDNSNVGNYYDEALVHKTIYKNVSTEMIVTKADTWISDVENTYVKSSSGVMNQEPQINNIKIPEDGETDIQTSNDYYDKPANNLIDGEVRAAIQAKGVNEYSVDTLRIVKNQRYDITETINESLEYTTYTMLNENTSSINVDKLVDLINQEKYLKVKNNMVTSSDFYFKLLNQDEKSQDIEQIMRYVLYKVTGNDIYGVNDESFEDFQSGLFTRTSSIYGGTIKEKVWFALKDLGYSDEVVAGAMGNIDYESGGFNTGAVEKEGTGIGLIQWSYGRADQLRAYAKSKGVEWKDEDTQVEFLIAEISGQGPAASIANKRTSGYIGDEKIRSTSSQWANSTTVEDATLHFMRFFESPAKKASYTERLRRAKNYYNEFNGKEKPEETVVDLTGDNKTKMEALLKEAQRIANDNRYRYSKSKRDQEFYYDCTSLVSRLYKKFFGITTPGWSGDYGGQYRVGPASNVKLQPGDVLWRTGHVTIYIGNGKYVAAHGQNGYYATHPNEQISVYTDSPSKYIYVYRFIK